MKLFRRGPRFAPPAILLALVLVSAGLAVWRDTTGSRPPEPPPRERAPLALFTTLPLYWNEAGELAEWLDAGAGAHWARTAIEARFRLRPLDVLSGEALAPFGALLAAQPRALSPSENVALDSWVRGGGRLLLLADPLLTAPSRFPLGDPRRPADSAMLSPLLARWGLELTFDPGQPRGEREAAIGPGLVLPVAMAGRLLARPPSAEAVARCRLAAGGIAARCRIGRGSALIVADAALLDPDAGDPARRARALDALLADAFGPDRRK